MSKHKILILMAKLASFLNNLTLKGSRQRHQPELVSLQRLEEIANRDKVAFLGLIQQHLTLFSWATLFLSQHHNLKLKLFNIKLTFTAPSIKLAILINQVEAN